MQGCTWAGVSRSSPEADGLVSYFCYSESPQTHCLQSVQVYYFVALKARSLPRVSFTRPKSKCHGAHSSMRLTGTSENLRTACMFCFRGVLLSLEWSPNCSASLLHPLCVWARVEGVGIRTWGALPLSYFPNPCNFHFKISLTRSSRWPLTCNPLPQSPV